MTEIDLGNGMFIHGHAISDNTGTSAFVEIRLPEDSRLCPGEKLLLSFSTSVSKTIEEQEAWAKDESYRIAENMFLALDKALGKNRCKPDAVPRLPKCMING